MSGPMIERLDHLVLEVADLGASVDFYAGVLGMAPATFDGGRVAVTFGRQKLNLGGPGRADGRARPLDFCLVSSWPIGAVAEHLADAGHPPELGPVQRTGAGGRMRSVYLRDPDRNIVEISSYPGRSGG